MSFQQILGQDAAVGTLLRALGAGRVHHAYRFEGPDGVGKERAAFALAQALVCETGGGLREGCGACSACRRAVTLGAADPRVPLHPDVLVVERNLYPPGAIGNKGEETRNISVNQLRRVVLSRLSFPPHEGRGRVIIVRRAEELSVSAANALLKTLEEPPAGTHFVLLTSRGRELIDTIRSRTLLVRFAPLGEGVIRQILGARGVSGEALALAVELSAGSAQVALESADPEASEQRALFVRAAYGALESPDAAASLALAQSREKDKDVLRDQLAALAASLAREARSEPEGERAPRLAERFSIALSALRELDRNASPALLLESMLLRMRASGLPMTDGPRSPSSPPAAAPLTLPLPPRPSRRPQRPGPPAPREPARALPLLGRAEPRADEPDSWLFQPGAEGAEVDGMLHSVVTVRMEEGGALFDVDPGEVTYRRGEVVTVEMEHGRAIGVVVAPLRRVLARGRVPRVLRRTTDDDVRQEAGQRRREQQILQAARDLVRSLDLPVKIVRVSVSKAAQRVLVYFASEERVDCRELLRKLGSSAQARIELRQMGLRDAARMIGGVGPCGLQLCCNTFLRDFAPVSIKMAKDQGLALNPQRVTGVCGRLLCCLVYEEAFYRQQRELLPRIGKRVLTPQGPGKVRDVDVLGGRVSVVLEAGESVWILLAELAAPGKSPG